MVGAVGNQDPVPGMSRLDYYVPHMYHISLFNAGSCGTYHSWCKRDQKVSEVELTT